MTNPGKTSGDCRLRSLTLRSFRNLRDQRFEPGSGRHLLLGGNGAGKTSLLEAIYLAATTRSFRTPHLADCCRHGTETFFVGAEADSGEGARHRLTVAWGPEGKDRSLDGTSSSPLADHLGVLPVVVWTSAEAAVLVGAPAERRRLLDRGVVGTRPGALSVLADYRRCLRQKRQLLSGGGSAGLEGWNTLLAEAGARIIALRQEFTQRLARAFEMVRQRCSLDLPPVGFRYRPSPRGGEGGVEAFREALSGRRAEEVRRGRPLIGPHRDELVIRWGDRELKRVASAGERKAVGLLLAAGLGAALEAVGRRPVFLLDDADSELDPQRLEAVWPAFGDPGQLFASSNRPEVWENLAVAGRWRLEGGVARPWEGQREAI